MTKFYNYDMPGKPVYAWNPIIMRCDRISEGCLNCWHLKMCHRKASNPLCLPEEREVYGGKLAPFVSQYRIDDMLVRQKPAVIAVQFMGDIGHDSLPISVVTPVFEAMMTRSQHTFLLLTKRPERLAAWLAFMKPNPSWYIGASCENQARLDERLPAMIDMASRGWHVWLSLEPLLGQIDIPHATLDRLSMVAVGPETGTGARLVGDSAELTRCAIKSIQAQCHTAGVLCYDKRDGGSRAVPW